MKKLMTGLTMVAAFWWVTVNFTPVMGPFDDYSSCTRAATDVSFGYHVFAVCMQKGY